MARTVSGEAEKRGGGGIAQGKRKSGVGAAGGAAGAPMTARGEGGQSRERKKTSHFQFESSHVLFSQKTAKSKEKKISAVSHRERQRTYETKRRCAALTQEIANLKNVIKEQKKMLRKKEREMKKSNSGQWPRINTCSDIITLRVPFQFVVALGRRLLCMSSDSIKGVYIGELHC